MKMDSGKTLISADTLVNAPIDTVWEAWVSPVHMAEWNNTSEEWHTPKAENDLRTGGKLFLRMETKDGSSGFNFEAIYDDVIINEKISYTISDGRKATILFTRTEEGIKITETSDPVKEHSLEFQQSFCQAILNNFKTYTENLQRHPMV
jgi:uncharacterized protein YndB with AHSA1/START domain